MKQLFVLGSFFPAQNGGPSNSILWLSSALAEHGHDVTVASLSDGITPQLQTEYNIKLDQENIVLNVKSFYFTYKISRHFCPKLVWFLCKHVKKYDQVNLTSVFFSGSIIACVICRLRGVPFSIAPRGELLRSAFSYGRWKKQLFWWIFGRRMYSGAGFVITTSEKERRETSSFFPPETTFKHLPNFVRIEPLQLNEDQLLAKRDILFLGRLHPIKAIDRLIQAYRLLTPDFKQHHRLLIAGQGDQEYTELLKDLAGSEPHVRFLGKIHGSQKSQVLTKARVLVLPSFSENYGNVVPEALAHFTPVITSTGTPWSHLEQVGCGWTVNNSPEDIAYAIQRILTKSDSEYIACAQESRRFVVENLNSQRKRDYISSVFTPSL